MLSVHYALLSHLLDMPVSQLSPLLPLRYRHGFHSRLEDLNRLLRYFLGGERPTQTTYQILSPHVFSVQIRICPEQEWYFTDGSTAPEKAASNPPTYATQVQNILNIKL